METDFEFSIINVDVEFEELTDETDIQIVFDDERTVYIPISLDLTGGTNGKKNLILEIKNDCINKGNKLNGCNTSRAKTKKQQ